MNSSYKPLNCSFLNWPANVKLTQRQHFVSCATNQLSTEKSADCRLRQLDPVEILSKDTTHTKEILLHYTN